MPSTTCSDGRARRLAATLLGFLAASGVARAHDFWIEPSAWRPAPGELVRLDLRVGEAFAGEALPRDEARIVRFDDHGPAGRAPVVGRDGQAPAGLLRPEAPGLHVLAYQGTPSRLALEAEHFEAYLREEGLERVIEARAARGESRLPGRERYARCAKALVPVGAASPAGADRPLGLALELVCEGDPFGDPRPRFRLLLEGEPLAGVLVVALAREAPEDPVSARTDADGRVVLPLPPRGPVLVTAVHMVRAEDDPEADWASTWASLTFSRGPLEAPRPAAPEAEGAQARRRAARGEAPLPHTGDGRPAARLPQAPVPRAVRRSKSAALPGVRA